MRCELCKKFGSRKRAKKQARFCSSRCQIEFHIKRKKDADFATLVVLTSPLDHFANLKLGSSEVTPVGYFHRAAKLPHGYSARSLISHFVIRKICAESQCLNARVHCSSGTLLLFFRDLHSVPNNVVEFDGTSNGYVLLRPYHRR